MMKIIPGFLPGGRRGRARCLPRGLGGCEIVLLGGRGVAGAGAVSVQVAHLSVQCIVQLA